MKELFRCYAQLVRCRDFEEKIKGRNRGEKLDTGEPRQIQKKQRNNLQYLCIGTSAKGKERKEK